MSEVQPPAPSRLHAELKRLIDGDDAREVAPSAIRNFVKQNRVALLAALSEIAPTRDAVLEAVEPALRYIQHVGANAVMRGEPHPQQWIVDKLEALLKSNNAAAGSGGRCAITPASQEAPAAGHCQPAAPDERAALVKRLREARYDQPLNEALFTEAADMLERECERSLRPINNKEE